MNEEEYVLVNVNINIQLIEENSLVKQKIKYLFNQLKYEIYDIYECIKEIFNDAQLMTFPLLITSHLD